MKRIILAALIPLASCVNLEEARLHDIDVCYGYGFVPGTPDFARCRQTRDERRSAALMMMNSDLEAQGNALMLQNQLQQMNANLSRLR